MKTKKQWHAVCGGYSWRMNEEKRETGEKVRLPQLFIIKMVKMLHLPLIIMLIEKGHQFRIP